MVSLLIALPVMRSGPLGSHGTQGPSCDPCLPPEPPRPLLLAALQALKCGPSSPALLASICCRLKRSPSPRLFTQSQVPSATHSLWPTWPLRCLLGERVRGGGSPVFPSAPGNCFRPPSLGLPPSSSLHPSIRQPQPLPVFRHLSRLYSVRIPHSW